MFNNDYTNNYIKDETDITNTTSTTPYTFPKDGYVFVNAWNNVGEYIRLIILAPTGSVNISIYTYKSEATVTATNSLFVKKGMRSYVSAKSTHAAALYYTLSSK